MPDLARVEWAQRKRSRALQSASANKKSRSYLTRFVRLSPSLIPSLSLPLVQVLSIVPPGSNARILAYTKHDDILCVFSGSGGGGEEEERGEAFRTMPSASERILITRRALNFVRTAGV